MYLCCRTKRENILSLCQPHIFIKSKTCLKNSADFVYKNANFLSSCRTHSRGTVLSVRLSPSPTCVLSCFNITDPVTSSLSSSDLSGNPFECDCKLFRLVTWLQEKGVRVRRPDAMLCDHPPELRHHPLLNISLLTCGTKYKYTCHKNDRTENVF